MLHFKELRIESTGKHLIIDVSVDPQDYYEGVILDSIIIDNQDTYVPNGPSSNPIYTYNVAESYPNIYSIPEDCSCSPIKVEEDLSYCFTYGLDNLKHVRLILSAKDLNISSLDGMYFVYAIATGIPSPDTPCGFDNSKIMGTVINLYPYYQCMMNQVKQLENTCEVPKGFIDNSLRLKALELCIRTGNYSQAIKYWNKFFKLKLQTKYTTNCNCYG